MAVNWIRFRKLGWVIVACGGIVATLVASGVSSKVLCWLETSRLVQRETGKVEWFNHTKGIGSIKRSSGENLVVVGDDICDGDKTLTGGETVEFAIRQTKT